MTDIPDAISSDQLRSLLSGGATMPFTEQLPELNFGKDFGGPCDLQFVVAMLVAKSTHGVNFIQLLMTALHLLCEGERHLNQQQSVFEDPDGKAKEMPETDRAILVRIMERHNSLLRSSVLALEQILEAYASMSSHARIQELTKTGQVDAAKRYPIDHIRSILLFSDELLDSLGITREDMTKYLESSSSFTSS